MDHGSWHHDMNHGHAPPSQPPGPWLSLELRREALNHPHPQHRKRSITISLHVGTRSIAITPTAWKSLQSPPANTWKSVQSPSPKRPQPHILRPTSELYSLKPIPQRERDARRRHGREGDMKVGRGVRKEGEWRRC
eukprot:scaffold189659_cov44-Tisochrysis_lutea.AAC.1